MILKDLRAKIKTPIFARSDVIKLFIKESQNQINTQLHRMIKRGDLVGVKRGLYSFPNTTLDEFVVANKLYTPSYVSLESALNVYGIFPDITAIVTSVTTTTSKKLNTPLGNYVYSKINKNLFFGYESVLDKESCFYYNIATPEKALLDFIYVRRIKNLEEFRVDMLVINKAILFNYLTYFPKWVGRVVKNA